MKLEASPSREKCKKKSRSAKEKGQGHDLLAGTRQDNKRIDKIIEKKNQWICMGSRGEKRQGEAG